MSNEKKYLFFQAEKVGEKTYTGIATRYFIPTPSGEVLVPGIFGNLSNKKIRLLFMHDRSSILGATGVNLELEDSKTELRVKLSLPPTSFGEHVEWLLDNKVISEMSVGFFPRKTRINNEDKQLYILKGDLEEISIVDKGAIKGTSIK